MYRLGTEMNESGRFSGLPRGHVSSRRKSKFARRNARERQDVLQGRRLGVLIFMMKGRHGRISLNRSIARCSKRSIGGASSGGRLRIFDFDPGFRRTRYGASSLFETVPSRPSLQVALTLKTLFEIQEYAQNERHYPDE
jgi:hypothetical protein